MKLLRKVLILSHRYLGIALCLLVAMWFASGIVMMYAGGMPRLDPDVRLARMPDLDLSKVRLTLADAAEKLDIDASAGWDSTAGRGGSRIQLLTVMDRPAYRFGGEGGPYSPTRVRFSEVSTRRKHNRLRRGSSISMPGRFGSSAN